MSLPARKPHEARGVPRRAAIRWAVGAVSAGALTGCDIDPPRPPGTPAAPEPSTPEEEPDVAVLREVATATDAVAATLGSASTRVPRLAEALAPLLAMHAAHRDLLGTAVEDLEVEAPATTKVPRRAGAALKVVRGVERDLVGVLNRGALAAESGDFARALACMAASVGQHLTLLAEEGPR